MPAAVTGFLRRQSSSAESHCAPSVSVFLGVLGIDQYCSYIINIRRDTLDQIRGNKGIVDKRETLGVPLQVTMSDPYINIWTGAWFNRKDIPSARLLVLCHPKTNTLAQRWGLRSAPDTVVNPNFYIAINERVFRK